MGIDWMPSVTARLGTGAVPASASSGRSGRRTDAQIRVTAHDRMPRCVRTSPHETIVDRCDTTGPSNLRRAGSPVVESRISTRLSTPSSRSTGWHESTVTSCCSSSEAVTLSLTSADRAEKTFRDPQWLSDRVPNHPGLGRFDKPQSFLGVSGIVCRRLQTGDR
jgi:hypothetical protein